jgi:hypothetical protein
VLVSSKSHGSDRTVWRVGRQRLAWRPAHSARRDGFDFYLDREGQGQEMLSWLAALLATLVVLPWRSATNRWPVVAYVVDPIGAELDLHKTRPLPRAEAQGVALDWAEHIRRHGRPPA